MADASDSKQKWNGKSRGGAIGTWIFMMLVTHVGLRAAYALLIFVVPYFVLFAPKSSHAVWYFGRHVRGLGRWRSFCEIFATYYVFGQCIIDRMAIGHGKSEWFTYCHENEGEMRNLLIQDIPAIVLSGHIGAWEAGTSFFEGFGKKMNVTMRDAEYKAIKKVKEKEADACSFNVIPVGEDALESVMRVKNALDSNEFVCFMGDRYMTGSPKEMRTFMGHKAYFPLGPFKIASTMRVHVAIYFALREPHQTYRFFFKVLPAPEEGKRIRAQDLLTEYISFLESIVKLYPRQWFNLYSYFVEDK